MQFSYDFEYKITVAFNAPLFGYNVKHAYGPKADDFARKTLKEMIEKNLDSIERISKGMICKIEKVTPNLHKI